MRRFTKITIDSKVYEVVEERKKMCNKVISNPNSSEERLSEAKRYLSEIMQFEVFLEQVKFLSNSPKACLSQDNEDSEYFRVEYLDSASKMKSLLKKFKRKKSNFLSYEKDFSVSFETHDFEEDRYINLFEVIYTISIDAGSNYFFQTICGKLPSSNTITYEEFKKAYFNTLEDLLAGQHSHFYVTLRKQLFR